MKMKRKIIHIVLSALLASVVLLSAFPIAGADEIDTLNSQMSQLDREIQKLEDKMSKSQSSLVELKSEMNKTNKNISSTQAKKENFDAQIKNLSDQIDDANDLAILYQNNIRENETKISELENQSSEQFEALKLRLRAAYENGNLTYLEMLLDSDDFADFLVSVERIGSMIDYESRQMDDLNEQILVMEQMRQDNDKMLSEAEKNKEKLKDAKTDMKNQADAAQRLIDDLNYAAYKTESDISAESGSIKAAAAEIEKNKRLQDEIDKQIEQILIERQKQQNAAYTGGTMMWPVPVEHSRISSPFGYRTYDNAVHRGIDIPLDYGDPVYAANGGTVVTATYHYSYGYYVLIDHGGGIATLYAHNSSLLVSAGDKVTAGQQIAKGGSTGDSQGNHCHFEVRENGAVVDPIANGYVAKP